LMDAASCFIFDMIMIPTNNPEPSKLEARRLLKKGWEAKQRYPVTLFVPTGRFQNALPAEAERHGITVVPVHESQLLDFIWEAREGFKEHFRDGGANSEA